MTEPELDPPARPASDNVARVPDGRCPDCGGPLGVTEAGQRGCFLCGTRHPAATDREGTS
jgi:hypothetical protein